MSKLTLRPTPFTEAYPAPWKVQGLEVVDRHGCHIQDFESDTPDDLEFWQGIVKVVNAAWRLRPLLGHIIAANEAYLQANPHARADPDPLTDACHTAAAVLLLEKL